MAATGLVGANPYQRGFNFDISSKPIGLLIDLEAKERARNDALDRYFMDYDKNINPAGMRGVDIDDLTRLNQASKEFYFKNKKNIQNPMLDGGRAYSQFSNYNKQQLALVASSKEEAAKGKLAQQAIMQANKEGRIVSPETFEGITRSQKRILDPEYKSWDASSFDAYKPFNPNAFFKEIYGENGERFNSDQTPIIKKQGGYDVITTPSSFDAKNLPVIESMATAKLNEKGYASHIKELANNPQYLQDFKKTNDVFKKFYGRDIDPNSQKDLSVGFTLAFAPTDVKIKTTRQRIETNNKAPNAVFNSETYISEIYNSNSGRIESVIDNTELPPAKKSEIKLKYPGAVAISKLPEALEKKYQFQTGKLSELPSFIIMKPNKNMVIFDADGKEIEIPYNVLKADVAKEVGGIKAVTSEYNQPITQTQQTQKTTAKKVWNPKTGKFE